MSAQLFEEFSQSVNVIPIYILQSTFCLLTIETLQDFQSMLDHVSPLCIKDLILPSYMAPGMNSTQTE